ncbi:MAG: hypothetical protein KatS3mg064_0113 [Tepidiforma sp.]|nr:ferric reductase-like transmembrane domain-containing protein [Tepidiforma sp.]GIW16956.1 MAG: hypothetical protein KatS3mg064_0113 [Tepidiforma sp.]
MTSWRLGLLSGLTAVAAILLVRASGVSAAANTWHALRAAGFVSYLLFWVSCLSGMAFYLRIAVPRVRASVVFELHRVTGVLAAAFLASHLVGVLVDPWIDFRVIDILAGATASYRPFALFLGAVGAWALAIVVGTTAVSGRFRYATWLNLHRLAFPGYVVALFHGLLAGSDSANPLVLAMYGLTAGAVAGLGVLRLAGRERPVPAAVSLPGR